MNNDQKTTACVVAQAVTVILVGFGVVTGGVGGAIAVLLQVAFGYFTNKEDINVNRP
jgi:hypothetical protein